MDRRPATVSVASLVSSRALQSPDVVSVLSPLASKLPSRVVSQPGISNKDDVIDLDPDELFAKYTITEVKARQAQLRADAEAKQEDLRIMVGERYRDLLQASSSIISIASSAKHVQEALEETITAIRSKKAPTTQNHVLPSGKDDSHLQTLQVLSAHIKLLLDAPEHLWRLIERERYFQATWLFLLTRVVHRALIHDEDRDDENWTQHGLDISEQFPLIQRQWETVSHFRTQIVHRATLSLRVHNKTPEEACAALLTLHILDSRPLVETLTIYLSQRTRALNALLTKSLDSLDQRSNGFLVTGSPPESRKISKRAANFSAKAAALAVQDATRTTLEVLSRTLSTARAVFGTSDSARSLMESVLDNIQSEPSLVPSAALSTELLLNTQAILHSLPSSSYVSFLPADIRSYRPFIDLSSVSSSLSQEALCDKLCNWFGQSTANLRGAFDKWLASLDVVSAVWKVRASLRKWLAHSGLLAPETVKLTELLDGAFHTRITSIWSAVLGRSEEDFLQALYSLRSGSEDDMFSPLRSLYRSSSVSQLPPGTGPSSLDPRFHAYKTALTQRLDGRAPRLNETLRTLEDAAAKLRKDLARMLADGEGSRGLVADLTAAYNPEAQALCVRVASTLETVSAELMASSVIDGTTNRLVFYAHVAKELSTSHFVCDIGCNQAVTTNFRERMNTLFLRIMSCWEGHVISKLVSYYGEKATTQQIHSGSACLHPSPPIMECLYLLSSSIHNLGMSHHQSYLMTMSQRMITNFSAAFVRKVGDGNLQVLYDLFLLHRLASKWKNAETTVLGQAIDRLQLHLTDSPQCDPNRSASEFLSKTQMLLSALLPHVPEAYKAPPSEDEAGMLMYGVPVVDTQFVPAVELAPPSSRFPLLLIDAR